MRNLKWSRAAMTSATSNLELEGLFHAARDVSAQVPSRRSHFVERSSSAGFVVVSDASKQQEVELAQQAPN